LKGHSFSRAEESKEKDSGLQPLWELFLQARLTPGAKARHKMVDPCGTAEAVPFQSRRLQSS
jgi:hypothetical protein